MDFESPIEWDHLRIIPNRNLLTEETSEPVEGNVDLPWGDDDLI